ncbi:MAG: TonB-dependent receptor [Pseudomonadota bacterium]|nr:TonB-dependent receptor [Pseudomonadota bacterium]GIT21219.1 MAG: TonB-dependent receptor [Gammaproteobacteria bacterium]
MNLKRKTLPALISLATLVSMQPTWAQQDQIEEVVVWGRSLQLIGTADSASQGVIGYADFSTRPIARVGELVEVVPGMIATQHSGPGKANQYFLRGFNLDHGSDFSTFFDGMPVNMRTHAHAQGYMDLNFIIPEIIERIDFQKGPYFADTGDFSLAGSNSMKTYDVLEEGFSELTLGSRDEIRFVTANSFDFAEGSLLYALEHQQTNGFYDLEQDVRKLNGLLKYTGNFAGVPSRITLSAYDSEWTSTNQVPQRAVNSGLIDRFGFIDPDLGGESYRYSITGNFELAESWDLNLYASSYYMSLINNPTYLLNDPINGDEFEQEDERRLFGGTLRNEAEIELFGVPVRRTVGSDIRYDNVDELNLFNTLSRRRISTIREDKAEEFSIGAFGELQFLVTDALRATVGVRYDYYDGEVDAFRSQNSGSDDDSLWQPNIGLAYRLNENLEFYGNYGHGFHSNDVRAAVNTVDPVTGDPTESLEMLVEGKGSEIGFRYDTLEGFNLSAAYYTLKMDSELVFVGDAGTTEPGDPSRRDGIEVTSFWEISDQLVFDISGAKSDGHFIGLPSGENAIPDAHDLVYGVGLTYAGGNGWTSSLRVRHFGDAALTEDEVVEKGSSTLLHFGLSYEQDNWEIGLDILNLLDEEDDDIAYWFESQLPGEAAAVEDIHFHPADPRTVRVLMKYKF